MQNIDRIRHIPTVIIHGRYDVICPLKSAWDLHRAFPEAVLEIIPASGHHAKEQRVSAKLVDSTNAFIEKRKF